MLRFERELPLADLKAELVLAHLSEIGTVRDTQPARAAAANVPELQQFQVLLTSDHPAAEILAAADVDGVESVEIEAGTKEFAAIEPEFHAAFAPAPAVQLVATVIQPQVEGAQQSQPQSAEQHDSSEAAESPATVAAAGETTAGRSKVVETVRVDIGRLDNLMNLAGELVVNKARFVQIVRQMTPAYKKSGVSGRMRASGDSMRRALQMMKTQAVSSDPAHAGQWNDQVRELESDIEALEEQSRLWEESRRSFGQFTEAIDQMSRVSDSLQRGVLETRMVPVGPLFNRFKPRRPGQHRGTGAREKK